MPAARIAAALILCLLSPLPAAAFDCSRATTDVEKAICASPVAKEADDRMARAYRELKAALPPDQARALLDSQRQWVTSRENRCNWRTDQERTRCVIDETAKRWRILAGLPEAGPGTGAARLQPLVIARQGNAKAYSIDISVVLFAHPGSRGERVFNRAVRALYADALLNEEIDFESPGELSYNLAVEVTYASPDFISALASGWRYDGGAHGNSWTRAVNVDLKHGRLIGSPMFLPARLAARSLAAAANSSSPRSVTRWAKAHRPPRAICESTARPSRTTSPISHAGVSAASTPRCSSILMPWALMPKANTPVGSTTA